MRYTKFADVLGAGAMLALVACGGTSSASPSPAPATPAPTTCCTPPPSPSASSGPSTFVPCTTSPPTTSAEPAESGPTGACKVAQILYTSNGPCGPGGSGQTYAQACPVTDDLGMKLDHNPTSGPAGGADPVCRCQATWMSATYTVTQTPVNQTQYTVKVQLTFGPTSAETFDVVVLSVESGSLADDILCGNGDPSTSIKGSSPGPCS
ncbi:MAG: hypothetical protein ABR498_03955 [Candidatus Dormibacteria bacterium]